MPRIEAKYSPEQREALASTWNDAGVRPARRIVAMAAAGEIVHNGERLPPFETRESTVANFARDQRNRRAGAANSTLAKVAPEDAVEALRLRLVRMADAELAHEEKAKHGKRDPERIRQLARAVREIAAIPGKADPRPVRPGQRDDTGKQNGGDTRGGLAGPILAAHGQGRTRSNAGKATAQGNAQHHTKTDGDRGARAPAHETTTEQETDGPGEWARAQAAVLLGSGAGEGDHVPST